MADQLDLFFAPTRPLPGSVVACSTQRPGIPSGAHWLALGLTPLQGFEFRYPRARALRGIGKIKRGHR